MKMKFTQLGAGKVNAVKFVNALGNLKALIYGLKN
jgi:hypothetical protein